MQHTSSKRRSAPIQRHVGRARARLSKPNPRRRKMLTKKQRKKCQDQREHDMSRSEQSRGAERRDRGLVVAMAAVEDVVAAGRPDPAPPPVVLASARTTKQQQSPVSQPPIDRTEETLYIKQRIIHDTNKRHTRTPSCRSRGEPRRAPYPLAVFLSRLGGGGGGLEIWPGGEASASVGCCRARMRRLYFYTAIH
jgi:hypothetical protein